MVDSKKILARHVDHVSRAVVSPQTTQCLEIPRIVLDNRLFLIKEYTLLVTIELIFNISESGCSDWEDRKPNPVLVSNGVKNSTLHDLGNRRIRDKTLICCISVADGTYYPLLISCNERVRQVFE
jgi:hypothetical protein